MKKILKILGIAAGVGILVSGLILLISLRTTHAQVQDTNNADLGAQENSNNVPATFTAGQTQTVGNDGNPIGPYVENTGIAPWYDDISSIASVTGSCGVGYSGYVCPTDSPSNVGKNCDNIMDNYSSIIQMHTDSNNPPTFPIGLDPENYMQTSTNRCTLVQASTQLPPPSSYQNFCSPPTGCSADPQAAQDGYVGCRSFQPGQDNATVALQVTCNGFNPDPRVIYSTNCGPYLGPGNICLGSLAGGVGMQTPFGDENGGPYDGPLSQDPDPGNPDTYIVGASQPTWMGNPAKYSIFLTFRGKTEVDPGDTVLFPLGSVQAPNTAGTYTDFFQMSSGIQAAIQQYGPSGDDLNDFGSTIPITITVTGGVPPTSTVTSVTVTCTPSTIDITQTSQCTATVNGTNNPSQAVTWSSTNGTTTSSGVFTPSGPGSATITATSVQDTTQSGTTPVTVNAVPTGTVSVKSVSTNNTPVPASWQILTPINNGLSATCQTSSTYNNQPLGTYTLVNVASCNSGYSFNSMREVPIAIHSSKSLTGQLLSFAQNMIASVANAYTLSNPGSQTLSASSLTANFIIVWVPVANISVNPVTISPSGTAGGSPVDTTVSVTNTGSPGSTLTWTASSSAPSWLTVSPASDSSGLSSGSSDSVTISADPSGLSAGTYTGNITFDGFSVVDSSTIPTPAVLTVSFTVNPPVTGGGSGAGFNCVSNACVAVPSGAAFPNPGGAASCAAACGSGGGSIGPTGTCGGGACGAPMCTFSASPSTIVIPEQSTLTYNCTNIPPSPGSSCTITGGNLNPLTFLGNASDTVAGTTKVSPTGNSTYTISCTGPGGTTSATASVSVSNSTYCENNPGGVNCPQH